MFTFATSCISARIFAKRMVQRVPQTSFGRKVDNLMSPQRRKGVARQDQAPGSRIKLLINACSDSRLEQHKIRGEERRQEQFMQRRGLYCEPQHVARRSTKTPEMGVIMQRGAQKFHVKGYTPPVSEGFRKTRELAKTAALACYAKDDEAFDRIQQAASM